MIKVITESDGFAMISHKLDPMTQRLIGSFSETEAAKKYVDSYNLEYKKNGGCGCYDCEKEAIELNKNK